MNTITAIAEPLVAASGGDPRLYGLLAARTDAARDEELTRLLAEMAPIVDGILARAVKADRLLRDSLDDLRGDVLTRILDKLRSLPHGGDAPERLDDYVATLARNCVYDLLRSRHPERTRLKNRVRFLLAHDRRFALWNGGTVCGRAEWEGQRAEEAAVPPRGVPRIVYDPQRPAEALLALFRLLGRPLELDALVTLLMDLWNVAEARAVPLEALGEEQPTQLAQLEARSFLAALWTEVAALPAAQRTALLLNLRSPEERNALALFLSTGIADRERIAAAIGMTMEELADLWAQLPLDDATIAQRLGITRQQVINLRKSARERLRRRLRHG